MNENESKTPSTPTKAESSKLSTFATPTKGIFNVFKFEI